ncbi:unnamed protein product [Closterium sp. NIES-54]
MGAMTRYLTSPSIPMARSPGGLWAHSDSLLKKPFYPSGLVAGILTASCLMKSSRQQTVGQLQPIPLPERTWQQVVIDFITRLPAGASGNDSISVVVDRLTKLAHFSVYKKSHIAEETTRLFFATVVRLHGIPPAIISDRDTKFTTNFWRNLWHPTPIQIIVPP